MGISAIGQSAVALRQLAIVSLLGLTLATMSSASALEPGLHALSAQRLQGRELVGHVMRRLGFGPTEEELQEIAAIGLVAYLSAQLDPFSIDDSELEARLLPPADDYYDHTTPARRWYMRMVYSRRQLLERMTLIWHEHFATSNAKVSSGCFMTEQEETLRRHSLAPFPTVLKAIARDQAMIKWLDNDGNDGKDRDDNDNPIPPNENLARELLQLFALGTDQLNLDGTPILDADDRPLPAYTEQDVKELARALTGWRTVYKECGESSYFDPGLHDNDDKVIFGETIRGRSGLQGARELGDAIEIIARQPTMAPFISRMLIQKIATETPTRRYIRQVANVFRDTHGDIRKVLIAIIGNPEFISEEVVASQPKSPIEQFVGILRAIEADTEGNALIKWTDRSGHRIYYPPSVFSFYPPGDKGALLDTARVILRDNIADEIMRGYSDTYWEPWLLIAENNLTSPEVAVDFLSDRLLSRPLESAVRQTIVDYMEGEVTEEKMMGAFYLVVLTPEFQLQ